jgi:hypothetical protein
MQIPCVQILCNKSVYRIIINIKLISDPSNCQKSILKNESPNKVYVCSHMRGRQGRGSCSTVSRQFTKSTPLEHVIESAKRFLNPSAGTNRNLHRLDTKFDCITMLQVTLLHFCDAITKHTSTRATTEPHVYMPVSSSLD